MKMKSFAMLMVSGLCAASLAYIAPAMADDMQQQSPSGTSSMDSGMSQGSGMGSGMSQGSSSSGSSNSNNASPDTPSGDDDY